MWEAVWYFRVSDPAIMDLLACIYRYKLISNNNELCTSTLWCKIIHVVICYIPL